MKITKILLKQQQQQETNQQNKTQCLCVNLMRTFVIFLRNFVRVLGHFLEICFWGHIIRETICISKLNLGTISEICKLENTVTHFERRIVINEIG